MRTSEATHFFERPVTGSMDRGMHGLIDNPLPFFFSLWHVHSHHRRVGTLFHKRIENPPLFVQQNCTSFFRIHGLPPYIKMPIQLPTSANRWIWRTVPPSSTKASAKEHFRHRSRVRAYLRRKDEASKGLLISAFNCRNVQVTRPSVLPLSANRCGTLPKRADWLIPFPRRRPEHPGNVDAPLTAILRRVSCGGFKSQPALLQPLRSVRILRRGRDGHQSVRFPPSSTAHLGRSKVGRSSARAGASEIPHLQEPTGSLRHPKRRGACRGRPDGMHWCTADPSHRQFHDRPPALVPFLSYLAGAAQVSGLVLSHSSGREGTQLPFRERAASPSADINRARRSRFAAPVVLGCPATFGSRVLSVLSHGAVAGRKPTHERVAPSVPCPLPG
ncbi:hypothetical protein MRX96_020721 [Rhipicephalus microplus]